MFPYRAVLVRLRQGDANRGIVRARQKGRGKVAAFRALAQQQGSLAADAPLPDNATIAAVVGEARRARSTISTTKVSAASRFTLHCAASTVTPAAIRR